MSENIQRHEAQTHIARHETSRGNVIECQTALQGTSGIAEKIGGDIIASRSTWFFKGEGHSETADSAALLLSAVINSDATTTGRFGISSFGGETTINPGQPTERIDPFVVTAIVAHGDEVSQEELEYHTYRIVSAANMHLQALQSTLRLPLPYRASDAPSTPAAGKV